MDHIHVVPLLEVPADACMSFSVSFIEICESLTREDDPPPKCVVRSIAFVDCDLVSRIGLLHEDCEVQSCRSTANNRYLHSREGLIRTILAIVDWQSPIFESPKC